MEDALAERGLLPEGNYSYGNDEISVTDVTGDNALLGADGRVYFIDPIINFKKPVREILGDTAVGSVPSEGGEPQGETALSRIPVDESGEPMFEAVEDSRLAWDGLMEYFENSEDAAAYVKQRIDALAKDVERGEKSISKAGSTSSSASAFRKARRDAREALEGKRRELEAWKAISNAKWESEREAASQKAAEEEARREEQARRYLERQRIKQEEAAAEAEARRAERERLEQSRREAEAETERQRALPVNQEKEAALNNFDEYMESERNKIPEQTQSLEESAAGSSETDEGLRELIEHEEALVIEAREQLRDELRQYYIRNNSPEDAAKIAEDMIARVQAEVEIQHNKRQMLRDILDDTTPATTESETTSEKVIVKAAGGGLSYNAIGHLPDAKTGEFGYVERQFSRSGEFDFTGNGHIKDRGDVAYLFRSLEDYSIEHVFAAFVKDGKVKVMHLGMGGPTASYANLGAIRAGYDAFGADKIFLVHNHPSGMLTPSAADQALMRRLEQAFGEEIEIDGLIIDTTSGRYTSFRGSGGARQSEIPSGESKEQAEVYRFDKLQPNGRPAETVTIRNSKDVVNFLEDQRFGDKEKISYLVLSNSNEIVGNFHTGYRSIEEAGLAEEIASVATKYGGTRVIVYGNANIRKANKLKEAIDKHSLNGVTLLDAVEAKVDSNLSAMDQGYLNEDGAKYGSSSEGEAAAKSIGAGAEGNKVVYEATKGLVEATGLPVVEVGETEAQAMAGNHGDAQLMGSRTDRKMAEVAEHYADKELDENQRKVVDVFSGKAENLPIEANRPEGPTRIVMRQGEENRAGTKHSLFRHYNTKSNNISAEDITLIPEIIAKGERTVNDKETIYDYKIEDGTRLRVTTERHGKKERFTNFLSNRKPLQKKRAENTQLSAPRSNAEVSGAKVGNISDATKSGGEAKLLRTSEGVVYGWTVGGKVYLNRDAMNPETPLHEYTHLWDEMVQKENPELWARGKELMKQTPVWEEVMNDPNYADIRGDEDAVASEVHSRLTGKNGAEIVKDMVEKSRKEGPIAVAETVTLVERLKRWLADMFKGLKQTLGKWSKQDLDDLTLEDFNNMTLRDLAEGINPRAEMRRGENARAAMEANPMRDDYHTGIRGREDAKTFDEMLAEAERSHEEYGELSYPDMSIEMLREAKKSGRITVYSSKPIETGAFVSPSRMNAQDYAGGGRVYSKEVAVDDIAWISEDEGQMGKSLDLSTEEARLHIGDKSNGRRFITPRTLADVNGLEKLSDRGQNVVTKFLEKYNSAPIHVISGIEDVKALGYPDEVVRGFEAELENGDTPAVFNHYDKKVYIFASVFNDYDKKGTVLIHENVHGAIDEHGNIPSELLDSFRRKALSSGYEAERFGDLEEGLLEEYPEESRSEEFLAYTLPWMLKKSEREDKLMSLLNDQEKGYVEQIIDKIRDAQGRTTRERAQSKSESAESLHTEGGRYGVGHGIRVPGEAVFENERRRGQGLDGEHAESGRIGRGLRVVQFFDSDEISQHFETKRKHKNHLNIVLKKDS